MIRSSLLCLLLASAIASIAPSPAGAQSLWMPRDQKHALLLEGLRPSLESSEPEFPSGAFFLGGRLRLSETAALVVELPYARFEGNFVFGLADFETNSSTVGNPYVGVELGPPGSIFFAELGVRAPVTSDEEFVAVFTGVFADPTRFDAFSVHTLPVHALFNIRHVSPSGLLTRLRFGPVVAIATEDDAISLVTSPFAFGETDLFAVYAWQIGYEGTSIRAGGAISGSALVTSDVGNLGTRTTNQLEVHADFGPWTVRPGLDLRVPMGSFANAVPVILGISVGAAF